MGTLEQLKESVGREAALIKRWADARLLGRPRDQRFFVLPNFLPEDEYLRVRDLGMAGRGEFFRKRSIIRSGAALGLHELLESPCAGVVDALVNSGVLQLVRDRTGLEDMEYVGPADRNQISLLYYADQGDGIDWHFDGNIYLGERWAGIYTLHEESADGTTKLEAEVDGELRTFDCGEMRNTLLLFQGDQVRHRVRPMAAGEERLVVNLLFSPTPVMTRNPVLRFYQSIVNYVFYGKLDA
jgi:hypothetical protein